MSVGFVCDYRSFLEEHGGKLISLGNKVIIKTEKEGGGLTERFSQGT